MHCQEWMTDEAKPHRVRIEHNRLSGSARVLADDEVVFERSFKFWDTGFEHRFKLGGLPAIVRAIYRTWHYDYELWLDGRLQ